MTAFVLTASGTTAHVAMWGLVTYYRTLCGRSVSGLLAREALNDYPPCVRCASVLYRLVRREVA